MSQPSVLSRLTFAGALALGAAGLAACETTPGPYAYSPYEAGRVARVDEGVVVSWRPVTFASGQNGQGALIGGATGAAVGSAFGGDTGGHIAGAIIGAIGGAAIGDAVQKGNTAQGFAYTIRRSGDGSLIEVAQPDLRPLAQGARVQIVYGDRVRIVPVG